MHKPLQCYVKNKLKMVTKITRVTQNVKPK